MCLYSLSRFAFNVNLRQYTAVFELDYFRENPKPFYLLAKAGGSLRTSTRAHNRAQLTFTVNAHADARTRFVAVV